MQRDFTKIASDDIDSKTQIQQIQSQINNNIEYHIEQHNVPRKPLPRHYGSVFPIGKLDRNGDPKYIIGPHYYVFFPTVMLCTWFLWYSLKNFYYQLHMNFVYIGCAALSAIFFIFSYIKVGISNPGIASSYYLPDQETQANPKYCRPCRVLKDNQRRHCLSCDVCIDQLDHHCPWVGKCIGKRNIGQFKIFICSAFLAIFTFATVIYLQGSHLHAPKKK